jgi:hypothetical protein
MSIKMPKKKYIAVQSFILNSSLILLMRRNSERKTKSLTNYQKINKRGFVDDIDDKLALMKINVVSDSEKDPDEMINPVKSDDISRKQPSENSNVSTFHQMAKESLIK